MENVGWTVFEHRTPFMSFMLTIYHYPKTTFTKLFSPIKQGAAIWHPRCGPGPDDSGMIVNGYESKDFDGASSVSEHIMAYGGSRASSPGASLRHPYAGPHFRSGWGGGAASPSLYHSSSTYSLRRPLEPGDRTGSTSHLNHFHLPASRRSSTVWS